MRPLQSDLQRALPLGPLFPSLQVPLPLLFVGWPREVSLLGRSR